MEPIRRDKSYLNSREKSGKEDRYTNYEKVFHLINLFSILALFLRLSIAHSRSSSEEKHKDRD